MSLILVGLFSAFIGSLVGLGGGFILVPILNLLMGFSMKDSIFLSLAAVFFLSVLQNIMNQELIMQSRKELLRLSFFAVIGSILAAWIGARSPDLILSVSFGIFLIVFGIFFLRSSDQWLSQIPSKARSRASGFLMTFAGITSGFFGIGGGIITVPVLHYLHLKSMQESAKLSFFVQFFATGTGLLVYFHSRRDVLSALPPSVLIFLLLGSFAGFILSRKIKLKDDRIKKLFATLIMLVGLWKIIDHLWMR